MFGMFAKSDLSLKERSLLLMTLVQAHLMGYVKHREWLSEDHRATVIDNWLKRYDRKAGIFLRGKLSSIGHDLSRHLAATLPHSELSELYEMLESASASSGPLPLVAASLLEECERILIAKGAAS